MNTTSTAALSAAGASGTLALTSATLNAGTDTTNVYASVPTGSQAGAFIQASADFRGSFQLVTRASGLRALGSPTALTNSQMILQGDQSLLTFAGPAGMARLVGVDQVTLTVTAYTSGSLTMSVVQ